MHLFGDLDLVTEYDALVANGANSPVVAKIKPKTSKTLCFLLKPSSSCLGLVLSGLGGFLSALIFLFQYSVC